MSKAYPKYKPSGVEWLGDVPEHWEVMRSDSFIDYERNQITTEQFAGQEVFHYSIPAVQDFGTGIVENGEDISSSKQRITCSLVLVSKLNPRKSTICIANPKNLLTIASTEFVGLIPKKVNQQFLFFLATSEQFRQRLDSIVQSVTRSHQRADPAQIYKFWSALPPLPEQQAIAAFLDRETGRIDALIAKKERLLELLAEQRAALISRAVTKGLDASVKLKPSGVEWLGDVPEHWEVKKLKHIASRITKGTTPSTLGKEFTDEGILFLKVESISDKMSIIDEMCVHIDSETHQLLSRSRLRENDVVLSIAGAIGRTAIIRKENLPANTNQALSIISPKLHRASPKWICYSANGKYFTTSLSIDTVKTAQENVSLDTISNSVILLPPLPEQQAIAAFLDRETAKIDALSAKVATVIERLKEYRTALISSAVTGKIDVREAV